jgi:Flp pilus assembly protein TadB
VTLLAAVLAAWAVAFAISPSGQASRRGARLTSARPAVPARQGRLGRPAGPLLMRIACVATGVLLVFVIGGVAGVVVGGVTALWGPRLLSVLESRSQRQRRIDLERQMPATADLLAACLAAGATPVEATRAVAQAIGDPIATPLRRLTGALDLGADPVNAWSTLASEATLRPMARAVSRSAETGAPLAALLTAVSDDQRDAMRARAAAAARAAGVRSVAPLVACFLPAFILVGIVPVVASLALPLLQ